MDNTKFYQEYKWWIENYQNEDKPHLSILHSIEDMLSDSDRGRGDYEFFKPAYHAYKHFSLLAGVKIVNPFALRSGDYDILDIE